MLLGFNTDNMYKAQAAFIVYTVYKSRDRQRGPSGVDMWGQIERFARASAKRNTDIDGFIAAFKRKMSCSTINPKYFKNENNAEYAMKNTRGEIAVFENEDMRTFALDIFENEEGKEVVKCIYEKTQIIILLVRDRLEREKIEGVFEDEN